jgi:hypothetical protein
MRSPHHLHGVFDMAPLSGFFGVALVLARLGILGRLGDSLEAVVCTDNLNAGVAVMKSAQDGV